MRDGERADAARRVGRATRARDARARGRGAGWGTSCMAKSPAAGPSPLDERVKGTEVVGIARASCATASARTQRAALVVRRARVTHARGAGAPGGVLPAWRSPRPLALHHLTSE